MTLSNSKVKNIRFGESYYHIKFELSIKEEGSLTFIPTFILFCYLNLTVLVFNWFWGKRKLCSILSVICVANQDMHVAGLLYYLYFQILALLYRGQCAMSESMTNCIFKGDNEVVPFCTFQKFFSFFFFMFSTIDGCCIGYYRNPKNNICESKLHYINFEILYQKSFKNDYDHEFFLNLVFPTNI